MNTIAADSKGKALYADIGAMPNVTDEKAAACNTALGQVTFPAARAAGARRLALGLRAGHRPRRARAPA